MSASCLVPGSSSRPARGHQERRGQLRVRRPVLHDEGPPGRRPLRIGPARPEGPQGFHHLPEGEGPLLEDAGGDGWRADHSDPPEDR